MGETAQVIGEWSGITPAPYEYARSMRMVEAAGCVALRGAQATPEGQDVLAQTRAEFDSSIAEMIKSDPELGDLLELTRYDTYKVIDEQVMAYDGVTPIEALIENGIAASREAAKHDKRMGTQAARDGADGRNMQKVGKMVRGEADHNTRLVVGLDPKEAMERDGHAFWEGLNYKHGLAYIQLYHATENGEVLAGTLSVDFSDKAVWRSVFAEYGVQIPEHETTDNWLDYAIETTLTEPQARALAEGVRRRYYEVKQAQTPLRQSINTFLAAHKPQLDAAFNQLYLPMTEAAASGVHNPTTRQFAGQLLQRAQAFKPEIAQRLLRLYNSSRLEPEDVPLLEGLIRYGVVESLRSGVKRLVGRDVGVAPVHNEPTQSYATGRDLVIDITRDIEEGARANRAYGACGNRQEIGTGAGSGDNSGEEDGPQSAFGGHRGEQILKCVTCPLCNQPGVDAHIKIIEAGKKKQITCSKCKGSKVYDN
jgi:hypothetical protein